MKALILPSARRKLKLARLSKMETDAHQAIQVAKMAWNLFIVIADKIKASGLWRLRAKTWKQYVHEQFGFKNTSRLSQYRKALPYQRILEAQNGAILEAHIRKLSRHVPVEHPLMPQAFQLGNKVAASMGKVASEAVYRRSLEVLQEADGDGIYQAGSKTFCITDEKQAIEAVRATLDLVKGVAIESQNRIAIKIRGHRRRGNLYELTIKEGNGNLPEIIEFTAYLKE